MDLKLLHTEHGRDTTLCYKPIYAMGGLLGDVFATLLSVPPIVSALREGALGEADTHRAPEGEQIGCVAGGSAMAANQSTQEQQGSLGYELFIAALSILSIANLLFGYLWVEDDSLLTILAVVNALFVPIFLGDFVWRLSKAPSKRRYFFKEFGWADLLSSLPLAEMKILRVFRLWRVGRFARKYGARNLWRHFIRHRADNALLTVVFLVICVLEFGALAALKTEQHAPGANITSPSDALWYVLVTITTVGYGDRFPVTNVGRLVGMLIMMVGVGLFGTLAGFLSNKFLAPPEELVEEVTPREPGDLKSYVAEIRRTLEVQERATAALRARLDEIDHLL